ncbi:MAG: hypothetical protein EOO07_33805 [Chitinophagaceae bacterium]|nr:MAG: hypothetical protein EOO07_33805 [Chitinophagaceae bacterium]
MKISKLSETQIHYVFIFLAIVGVTGAFLGMNLTPSVVGEKQLIPVMLSEKPDEITKMPITQNALWISHSNQSMDKSYSSTTYEHENSVFPRFVISDGKQPIQPVGDVEWLYRKPAGFQLLNREANTYFDKPEENY